MKKLSAISLQLSAVLNSISLRPLRAPPRSLRSKVLAFDKESIAGYAKHLPSSQNNMSSKLRNSCHPGRKRSNRLSPFTGYTQSQDFPRNMQAFQQLRMRWPVFARF